MKTPAQIGDPIRAFLGAVRVRLQRRQAEGGLAVWATVVGVTALLLLVAAGAFGPSNVWRPLGLVALVAAAGAVSLMLYRAYQMFGSDDAVARFVGARLPAVGGDLLSAVELERELPKLAENPVLSPKLVDALRTGVATRLQSVEPHRLVDMRAQRRKNLLRLLGVALAYAIVLWAWPQAFKRGWAELLASRTERFATSAEPIVGDLKLELRYPAYTGLPPRSIPASSGQVLALPGTEVQIEARALLAARAARITVEEDGQKQPAEPQPATVKGSTLSASFVAKKPGGYRFSLDGPDGRIREPEAHRIDLEQDRPPRVDLYAPAEALEVEGPRRIELAYSIDDDYGLGDVELVWRVGDGAETRRTVRTAQPGRSASSKLEWDLGELDLKPGSKVAYHLEAKDNDNVSGPNIGMSRTYYLSISSPREKHEAAVGEQEKLLELATAVLADRLEVKKLEDGELVEAFGKIHGHGEALLLALNKSEQALDGDKQASADTKKELREMHARLSKLNKEEEQLLTELREKKRRPNAWKAGVAKPLEAGNARQIPELERDVIALDDLLGRQRLEELLRVGDEMTAARDRLKQLMAQYKSTRSDATRKEIERELREIERKLAELAQKAQKLASELPDQFLNSEAMGKNDVQDRLDRIRDLLAKGDVEQAMAELEKMSSTLDKMMSSMEGDLKGFRDERFSAEEKAMAELEDKLTDLQHDEQEIKAGTEAIRQRTKQEAQKQMRDKVQPFIKKAREQVAVLRKHLADVEQRALSPYDQEELGRAKQRTEDLDKMLQAGDLEEARGMARAASGGLESLDADLRDEEARGWHGPRPGAKRAHEHVVQGRDIARQLADQIDKTLPQPGELLSPEDQKKMGELAERQQATRRRTQDLGREMDKKVGPDGKPMPQLPPQVGEGLKQAGQHMERAEHGLARKDSRDAEGEESQSLEKLSKLKEQMQQQRRPKEQMAGSRMDKEPVRIPGADEYKAPKEFRQDLLEAMKRGAPAEYKDQVKRYYEELVK